MTNEARRISHAAKGATAGAARAITEGRRSVALRIHAVDGALDPNTAPAATHPRTERSRRAWIIGALVLALLLYIASPYYAFWRFTVAIRSGDAAHLSTAVDFVSLRKSLRKQLNARIAALRPQNPKRQRMFDTLSSALGGQVVDSLLDAYLTPEGLAAFLANPKLPSETAAAAPPPNGAPPADAPLIAPETSTPGIGRRIDWSKVHYAFFTGPRDFLVDLEGTKLRFRFSGLRWKLRAIELDMSKLKV